MSVLFPPVILGPEMDAPILWAPGIFGSFCWKTRHAHKIPLFFGGGGGRGFLEGGGVEVPILFLWAWGFFPIKDIENDQPPKKARNDHEPIQKYTFQK